MNDTTQSTEIQAATDAVETKTEAIAKSVLQRANRKRFSFGDVWNASVIAGKATDTSKLIAQAVKLNLGTSDELSSLSTAELCAKVATALQATQAA